VLISLFCIDVTSFIHSQYAMFDRLRIEQLVISRLLFEVISGKFDYEKEDWRIKGAKIYPKFIQERIERKERKSHSIKKVCPLVVICWFFKSLTAWCKNKDHPKNAKINLIESSLYCFISIPTLTILLLLIHDILVIAGLSLTILLLLIRDILVIAGLL